MVVIFSYMHLKHPKKHDMLLVSTDFLFVFPYELQV